MIRGAGIIHPTEHEKREWSRMAQSAYRASLNAIGHRYSAAAALRSGEAMRLVTFDSLQADYRSWLIDGFSDRAYDASSQGVPS